mmetsp:Transcript_15421/g.18285  ORF Transcript_15421/g.18285 Transcript_15421/m.18285 type:complete len:85 (+) Transcript_15421:174-428(+)
MVRSDGGRWIEDRLVQEKNASVWMSVSRECDDDDDDRQERVTRLRQHKNVVAPMVVSDSDIRTDINRSHSKKELSGMVVMEFGR